MPTIRVIIINKKYCQTNKFFNFKGEYMPYFVTYELEYRKTFERTNAKNVILKKTHPIEWASRSSEFYLTYLLFFAEITDEQVELSNNFCTIED